jgi:hypothetical protein
VNPPKRLLNSREVGEMLGGLSNRAVTQRLGRPHGDIPEPDYVIEIPGRGDFHGWLPGREDLVPQQPAPDDPALLGEDPSSLPDDMLIGPKQLAKLMGWSHHYLMQKRSEAGRKRAQGRAEAKDLPAEDEKRGVSPRWRMSTVRAWEAVRSEKQGKDISEEE